MIVFNNLMHCIHLNKEKEKIGGEIPSGHARDRICRIQIIFPCVSIAICNLRLIFFNKGTSFSSLRFCVKSNLDIMIIYLKINFQFYAYFVDSE